MAGKYLIFGATGGIGTALARMLAARGERVFASGRQAERTAALAAEMGTAPFVVDATDSAQVTAAVRTVASEPGGLAGVANCIGSLLLKPAHITTDEEWAQTLATNLNSSFFILRESAKQMQATGGAIVLVSTAAAQTGLANHEAIAAAKGGVEGLALSAAATYANKRIRVNCVAPGLTETPLTQRITGNETAAKASLAMHALGRFGRPEDVARAMAWLLEPANDWVTGQVLGVDGGLGRLRPR